MNAPYAPPQGLANASTPYGNNMANPLQAPAMGNNMMAPPAPVTHDVTVLTTKKLASAKVLGVPPEEFGIERGARDIKTCNYCFHEVVTKTRVQLVAEGYDEDQVDALGDYRGNTDIETIARDSIQEDMGSSGVNKSAQPVKTVEHYVRMDYEGKGKPCLYMVVTGGDQGEILRRDGKEVIEAIDIIPFAVTTPVPITHRFFGRSIADLVLDVQKIKTSLLRAGLDSKYMSTGADVEISEAHVGASTIDDLLGPKRPGRLIRTKLPGGLTYQVVPDTSESSFSAMAYMDSLLEMRTGVTRQGQGVDAEALQNQSATAVTQVFSAAQARMKLIARIMAEGVRDIFSLLHHTIRSHGQEKQTVRLRNSWTEIDPRDWKTRNDMTINVALGNGGRSQQFAQTMAIANVQEKLVAGGKGNLVGDQELYNTAAELTKIMGHKNPNKFFNDPSAKDPQTGQLLHPPLPPPPDPKVMAIQAQAQNDQLLTNLKAQLDQQKAADAKALAEAKAEFAAKLEALKAHFGMAQEAQKAQNSQQQHRASMVESVVGIVADAHAHDNKMEQGAQAHQLKMQQTKENPDVGK